VKKNIFSLSIFSFIILLGCAKASKKVLLIFSYHPEYSWVVEQTRGVEDILKDKVYNQENEAIIQNSKYKIEKFYLDTKRNTSAEWKTEISEKAVEKINEFKPDIVIVFDDNACELVAKQYIGKKLPFVFCGMNGEPSDYGFPAENITGVIERLHINESYHLLKQILPDVEKIAFITDNSITSQKIVSRINKVDFPAEISEIFTINDLDEWKTKIKDFQTNVDAIGIILYHTIKEDGKRIPSEEVINWTLENNQLAEFVFWDFVIADGAFCGVTISGYEQGKAAAEIAKRILNGEKPSDIQISRENVIIPMINLERAKQLNLKIDKEILKKYGS